MKLEQNINIIEDVGFDDSVKMGITTNAAKIQFLLAENTYSDSIGSLIRESVSNGVDATIEINRTDPVLVELVEDNQYNYWFKVSDLGIGISPDRMYNVIANYGTSTKEQSNTQIGAMGIGAKAPFSYTDIFFIDTWFNNVHYKYCFSKGLDGHEITKLIEEEEIRQSGTTVSIQLKSRYDVNTFIEKIKEQLCYFKQVIFNVTTIDNDYKIIERENWIYSGLNQDSKLHISLGGVYYPLDFTKLGIKDICIPIALKFELGCGLQPIPNRERLILNTKSVALIKAKLELVAQEFADLFNSNIEDVEDYNLLLDYYKFNKCLVLVEQLTLDVRDFKKYVTFKSPNFKNTKVLTGLQLTNLKSAFQRSYTEVYWIKGNTFAKIPKQFWRMSNRDILDSEYTRLILDVPLTPLLKDYLADHYDGVIVYYPANRSIGYNEETKHRYSNSYSEIFNWDESDEAELLAKIEDFELVEKNLFSYMTKISTLVPSQEWLDERAALKKNKKQFTLEKQEINPGFLVAGKNKTTTAYGTILNKSKKFIKDYSGKFYKKLVVYGRDSDYLMLEKAWAITPDYMYSYCVLPERDFKRVKQAELKNWIHIDDFIKSKYCQKLVTNFTINRFCYNHRIDDMLPIIRYYSRQSAVKLNNLLNYKFDNSRFKARENEVLEGLCECDSIITNCLHKVEELIQPFKQIGTFPYNKFGEQIQVDALKYRKIRLNLEFYKQNNIQTDNESEIEDEDGE